MRRRFTLALVLSCLLLCTPALTWSQLTTLNPSGPSSGGGGGGSGTVTEANPATGAGTLTNLGTFGFSSQTTTPTLAISLSQAGAHTFWGNNTGSAAAPNYVALTASDLPSTAITPGTYGSATAIPACTFDAQGRATGCTNTPPQLTLSGTYFSSLSGANLTGLPAAQLSGTITSATQDLITRTGTLTSGATGAGFTLALSTSTVTGTLADTRLSSNVALRDSATPFSVGQQATSLGLGVAAPALAGQLDMTAAVSTGTVPPMFRLTGGAHTALTASTERNVVLFDFAQTRQWATGAGPTIQAAMRINPGTLSAVAASTFGEAATVYIAGAQVKGANVTLTQTEALRIDGGAVSTAAAALGLVVNAPTGAVVNYAAAFSGSVGINTVTPRQALDVVGNLEIGNSGGNNYALYGNRGVSTPYKLIEVDTNSQPTFGDGVLGYTVNISGYNVKLLSTIVGTGIRTVMAEVNDTALIVGTGNGSSAPIGRALRGPDGVGTNVAGVDTTIQASLGTGSGAVGNLVFKTSTAVLGSGTTAQTAVTHLTIGAGAVKASVHLGTAGTAPAVSNTSANSCGTTAATLVGTDQAGKVTVGATAGTSCTVTFATAFTTAPSCVVSNEVTANLARATSTTTTAILAGTFVAGDVLAYQCSTYF